jgi:hypothetical protein
MKDFRSLSELLASSSNWKICHKIFMSGLIAALGWVGVVLSGPNDAQAAPYCLLAKPQLGRPDNCFEFYLADVARSDGGALATVVAGMCSVTPLGLRQNWGPSPLGPGPHATWQIGDLAMGEASPYHKNKLGCGTSDASATPPPPPLGTGGGGVASASYYVFVLENIGLVLATQDTVRTRPSCDWAGGGPQPCSAPASVVGTLGGPYPTEAAARADMRTKLDCQSGHWGTFINYGTGRAWLQNNITGSDCRSMKQL